MNNIMNKKLKKRKGFTLIELIVVLAILGILAAIAVPNFTGIQEDAKLKADRATSESIIKAARLQHFSAGDDVIKKLDNNFFSDRGVTVQSKHFTSETSENLEDSFYLIALDRDGTDPKFDYEYAVLWIITDKAGTGTGKMVLENGSKIYDVTAIDGVADAAVAPTTFIVTDVDTVAFTKTPTDNKAPTFKLIEQVK